MPNARTLVASASILAVCAVTYGGDLNPPPGAVAPTDRVRINPETAGVPIVIDEPGSYVLTGPVLDCIGCDDLPNHGIVISAADVTLDCNGFQIVGDPENSAVGISLIFPAENVVIRNGTVRNWSFAGILGGGTGVTLEDMRVNSCGQSGGGSGISLSSEARVVGCTSNSNGGAGIQVSFGATVQDCIATGNTGNGIETAFGGLTNGSVLENCVSRNNGGIGFSLGDGTTARGCSASQNGGAGMIIGPGGVASGCSAVLNGGTGIEVVNALAHGCAAAWNTGADITLTAGGVAIDSHDAP